MIAPWSSSPLWQTASWVLLHDLWIAALLGLLALLARAACSRWKASARHTVAAACFLSLAAAPVALWCIAPPPVLAPSELAARIPSDPLSPEEDHLAQLAALQARSLEPAAADSPPLGPESVLPALWLLGAPLALLARLLAPWGAARLRRSRRMVLAGSQLQEQARRLARRVGVPSVPVLLREAAGSPFVLGLWRPCIVLPMAAMQGLKPAELEMVLLHELHHLRQLDPWWQYLQRCIEAVLFFHPAVWWVSRWWQDEREARCDASVLQHGVLPAEYARTLLRLGEAQVQTPTVAVAMAQGPLRSRVERILGHKETPMIPWLKASTLAALAGLAWAWCNPASAQEPLPQDSPAVNAEPQDALDPRAVQARTVAGAWHFVHKDAVASARCTDCHVVPASEHEDEYAEHADEQEHTGGQADPAHQDSHEPAVPPRQQWVEQLGNRWHHSMPSATTDTTNCSSCHVGVSLDAPNPHLDLWTTQESPHFAHSDLGPESRCIDCHVDSGTAAAQPTWSESRSNRLDTWSIEDPAPSTMAWSTEAPVPSPNTWWSEVRSTDEVPVARDPRDATRALLALHAAGRASLLLVEIRPARHRRIADLPGVIESVRFVGRNEAELQVRWKSERQQLRIALPGPSKVQRPSKEPARRRQGLQP